MLLKKNKENKLKIIIIAGPTASGKSSLALDLAKKYNASIILDDAHGFGVLGEGRGSQFEFKPTPEWKICQREEGAVNYWWICTRPCKDY